MKKEARNMLRIIVYLVIILAIIYLFPVKFSVDIKNLKNLKINKQSESLIICEQTQITGANWIIIGNENGLFGENISDEPVIICGNIPEKELNNEFFPQPMNRYVFRGIFIGNENIGGGIEYRKFEVKRWDIVLPVNRYSSRPAPPGYLTIFDFKWGK